MDLAAPPAAHATAEVLIRLDVEPLPGGRYVATSPDVPGLVTEAASLEEVVRLAQGNVRALLASCREHGDPIPDALARHRPPHDQPLTLKVPVQVR